MPKLNKARNCIELVDRHEHYNYLLRGQWLSQHIIDN